VSTTTVASWSQGKESATTARPNRGWLMRRALVVADLLGLTIAFVLIELSFGSSGVDRLSPLAEVVFFVATLPLWIVGAKIFGLYDRDEARAEHSTIDELVRVAVLITVGAFLVTRASLIGDPFNPDPLKLTTSWLAAIVFVSLARATIRGFARRHTAYIQETLIVGAGEIGQRIARKLLQHPEYGINLIGFIDDEARERMPYLHDLRLLGGLSELPSIVAEHRVDRVIIAFTHHDAEEFVPLVRRLRDSGVQVDIVPRFFDAIGPKIDFHFLEGMPLVGLPPVKLSRSARAAKRAFDAAASACLLLVLAPLLGLIALAIVLDSPGPVFFRQERLGKDMRRFTMLKFRTMTVGTDDADHRAFIAETMNRRAAAAAGGLYKLDRAHAVTRMGRLLRKTSLDELPQLLNVLRGEMSLVGPRPCIDYETEHFEEHHFQRFLVPPGITGLWQTSARAHSTFAEALDLDVLYAQSWSFGLDLLLLARTPLQVLRSGQTR
jgi:exopolysaccharide biosynthesis polyprenyl glycosylphosphotransferase